MRETRNAMLVKAALISTILLCPISSGRTCCEEIDWETVVKVARALSIGDSPPRPSASDALESRAREVLSRLQHPLDAGSLEARVPKLRRSAAGRSR